MADSCEHVNEASHSMKGWQFLMNESQFFKKDSDPWSELCLILYRESSAGNVFKSDLNATKITEGR